MSKAGIRALALLPVLLPALTAAWVYTASERHLRSFDLPPAFEQTIATDTAAIERGAHLARTRGCFGCHGKELAGEQMWGYAVAPNLPALARSESAAALEAAIRHGIGHDGKALYAMPSYNFVRMRDQDVADIIAFLRSLPVAVKELPEPTLPWAIRWDLAFGMDAAIPAFLDRVPPLKHSMDSDPALARGEYLAMTTCNECHGFGLRADTPWDDLTAPDLIIVMAYSEEDFRTLMKTGKALGNRELEMMSGVARGRFAAFTDEEIADLYRFLRDMAEKAVAAGEATD